MSSNNNQQDDSNGAASNNTNPFLRYYTQTHRNTALISSSEDNECTMIPPPSLQPSRNLDTQPSPRIQPTFSPASTTYRTNLFQSLFNDSSDGEISDLSDISSESSPNFRQNVSSRINNNSLSDSFSPPSLQFYQRIRHQVSENRRLQNTHSSNTVQNLQNTQNFTQRISNPVNRFRTNPSIHPQFRAKIVYRLQCKSCDSDLCIRGMRATLLGNSKLELFSTDSQPGGVSLVFNDYTTRNCACKIKDAACLGCGNVVGYHVTQPCISCLSSCNNGHFWMFLSDGVRAEDRVEYGNIMKWEIIPNAEFDSMITKSEERMIQIYELSCR